MDIKVEERIKNNFRYHAPSEEQKAYYEALRQAGRAVAFTIESLCPDSREKALAQTKLEEAIMWANAAIARNE